MLDFRKVLRLCLERRNFKGSNFLRSKEFAEVNLLLLFKLIYIHGDLSVPWFSKSRATTKIQYIIKLPNKYYLH
jgi:hypothetical protein